MTNVLLLILPSTGRRMGWHRMWQVTYLFAPDTR